MIVPGPKMADTRSPSTWLVLLLGRLFWVFPMLMGMNRPLGGGLVVIKVFLKNRVAFANLHAADLFISIHVNYLPVEPVTLIEAYYFRARGDKASLRLARKENQHSGYAMNLTGD